MQAISKFLIAISILKSLKFSFHQFPLLLLLLPQSFSLILQLLFLQHLFSCRNLQLHSFFSKDLSLAEPKRMFQFQFCLTQLNYHQSNSYWHLKLLMEWFLFLVLVSQFLWDSMALLYYNIFKAISIFFLQKIYPFFCLLLSLKN